MNAPEYLEPQTATHRYARCIELSRRVRWEIDKDVIRGRRFDFAHHFLPEGLARTRRLAFLSREEQRLLGQVQGRTYANMFGLVERFIGAQVLEASRDHWLGDQVALEALLRFADEELKHQALFRRVEAMIAEGMPAGYAFAADPDTVARSVLAAGPWAVLALTCHIELFTQAHYRESIDPDEDLSPLYRDIFLYHWREESQHALLDELEWRREDARLSPAEREAAVDAFIGLVGAMDAIVARQAEADAHYFQLAAGRLFEGADRRRIGAHLLAAYRWQYILSGTREPRFRRILASLVTGEPMRRIEARSRPLEAADAGP